MPVDIEKLTRAIRYSEDSLVDTARKHGFTTIKDLENFFKKNNKKFPLGHAEKQARANSPPPLILQAQNFLASKDKTESLSFLQLGYRFNQYFLHMAGMTPAKYSQTAKKTTPKEYVPENILDIIINIKKNPEIKTSQLAKLSDYRDSKSLEKDFKMYAGVSLNEYKSSEFSADLPHLSI